MLSAFTRFRNHEELLLVFCQSSEQAVLLYIYTWRAQRISQETNFARNPQTTDGEAANPGPRMRRRGPRSADAIDRRASRQRLSSAPVSDSNCDWTESRFRILHINIRGWTSHAAELTARIRQMDEKPDLIYVNETFLSTP